MNGYGKITIYDSLGNYLYCSGCIQSALEVSSDQLDRQHRIKRQQSQTPVINMTKAETETKHLSDYVIMQRWLSANGGNR